MAKTPQMRISWSRVTGYFPAKSGNTAAAARSTRKAASRGIT